MIRISKYVVLTGIAFGFTACSNREAESATAQVEPVEVVSAVQSSARQSGSASETIKVYKDPNCGCCNNWVDHLREHGFTVETMDMPDLRLVKQKYGIGQELQSCHTAVVGDYAIEGHVPADLIKKMLAEKPAVTGLAVPGMPMGSPGMEGATKERYDVLTFDRAGRTTVYAQR